MDKSREKSAKRPCPESEVNREDASAQGSSVAPPAGKIGRLEGVAAAATSTDSTQEQNTSPVGYISALTSPAAASSGEASDDAAKKAAAQKAAENVHLAKLDPGVRLQVKWELAEEDGNVRVVWWGCRLVDHGKFSTLLYDADHGFEETPARVTILKVGKLFDYSTKEWLSWRIEDLSQPAEADVVVSARDIIDAQEEIEAEATQDGLGSASLLEAGLNAINAAPNGHQMAAAGREWIDFFKVKLNEIVASRGPGYTLTGEDIADIKRQLDERRAQGLALTQNPGSHDGQDGVGGN